MSKSSKHYNPAAPMTHELTYLVQQRFTEKVAVDGNGIVINAGPLLQTQIGLPLAEVRGARLITKVTNLMVEAEKIRGGR